MSYSAGAGCRWWLSSPRCQGGRAAGGDGDVGAVGDAEIGHHARLGQILDRAGDDRVGLAVGGLQGLLGGRLRP